MGLAVNLGFALSAGAGTVAATPADQPVVPGEWHLSLPKVLDVAQARGIPVLGFWSNPGCSRCAQVIDQAVNTPEFTAWRQNRKLLMVTGEGKTGTPGELYGWMLAAATNDGNTSYPFLRLYWVQKDGTVEVDTRFSGYPYRADAQTLIDKIESFVAAFSYQGFATFAFTAGPEMEPATAAVPLPLVRRYGSAGCLTNTLGFVRTLAGGGTTNWTETLVWADGETNRNVMVANQGHYAGGTVTVTLCAEGENDQTAVIAMVTEQAITVHNPRFVGEPFNFGEWTMDLAAATNAVAASGDEKARTIVFFTGMWCPYCTGFEDDVLDSDAFKAFAQSNHLALAVIGIPSRDGMYAGSHLTHNVFTNTANAADRRCGINGTSYMTRHGITPETGWANIERILAFERQLTLPDKTFVNLPAVIMLRKDGTIAGRIPGYYCFDYYREGTGVYPPFMRFPLESNMARLHELLEMSHGDPAHAHEEENTYAAWTRERLGVQHPLGESISAVDNTDFFLLDAVNGTRQSVTVTGEAPLSVRVALLENDAVIAAASGPLADGVTVAADILENAVYHVNVTTDDPFFSFTNVCRTARPYAAGTTISLVAREQARMLSVAALTNATGVLATTLDVAENAVYRLFAADAEFTPDAGLLVPVAGDTNHLFRAAADGSAALALAARSAEATFTWQAWRPGTVGFAPTGQTIAESATEVLVTVERRDGSSGPCTVWVALDPSHTTATAGEDFTDVFGAGHPLTWADGEAGAKSIALPLTDDLGYEGDEVVALTLAVVDGAAAPRAGATTFELTIIEDDRPVVGRLAFTEATPYFAKQSPLTVVAREGTQVVLGATRVEGASTAVSAAVTVSAGTAAPGTLAWANNDRTATQPVTVTLPLLAETPKSAVKVTLTPDGTIRTVPGRQTATILLIAADAPGFAQETAAFPAQTSVAFAQGVEILQTTGGRLRAARLSGTLPPGIAARVDQAAGRLIFSGVPSRAGTYTSVYRITETRGGRGTPGGTVRVAITVAALETLNAAAADSVRQAEGAVIDTGDTMRVAGTLGFSVSKTGRATAKYRTKAGTITFSNKSWSACDADGLLTTELAKGAYRVAVCMTDAGELSARVTDPAYANPLEATLAVAPWGAANPATAYEGYYTVTLSPEMASGGLAPTGYSYLTISLKSGSLRTGRATYAGRLADGTPFSGSGVLQPQGDGTAQLAVYVRKNRRTLAALLAVGENARETYLTNPSAVAACGQVEPYWSYDGDPVETSFDIAVEVCGGYYNSADSLLDYYESYDGTGPMFLAAAGDMPESAVYGAATAFPFLELALTETSMRLQAGQADPTRTRFSFNKRTGLFHGTMRIPFAHPEDGARALPASYAGVLMPGWTKENCQCADGELDLPLKPFGLGAYWFKDKVPVETDRGIKAVPFVSGYPLIIDRAAE
jgi:hypothetical protein